MFLIPFRATKVTLKFKRVISIKSLVILVDREHYFPPIPDSFQPLPDAVDIVIIGAGIIGISTAWFLAKQGIKVLVCEKGRVAGEPSSRNWGWIRQQGRDEAELPIMMESLNIWQKLSTEFGTDIGFRREGSLYLCENETELAQHDRFLSFSSQYGLESK